MGNLLYIIAVILVIGWLVGFFGYAAGGLIHVLLVLAVIAILININKGWRRKISNVNHALLQKIVLHK